MAQIFPIDFDEKLTIAQDDFILFSDSEDWNKIKKAQYSNLKWEQWNPGTAATITVWSTTTWAAWSSASVVNSWTTSAAVLDFTIPEWEKGDPWDTWASVTSAAFNWNDIDFWLSDWTTVTLEDAKIDLKWDTWDAATISVWTTTTWEPGTNASVTNSGTSAAAVFNFTIPKGAKWDPGETWSSATISVGTTTTGDAGTSASVTNSGTSSAAVFNFTIPKGDKWDTWSPGADGQDGADWEAATITVWSTTTGNPWTSASVVNSWTSSAAVFDFTIPQWATGATGNGIASVTSSKSGKITTVTITETDWDSSSFTVSDGADWQWAWDVVWPASSTDWDIVLFDGVTGKLIKDWSKALSDLVQTSWNQSIAWTKTFTTSPVVPNKTSTATNTWTEIATEAQVYTVADAVSTINWKISSNASSSNKLMDKTYIDDAINSVTAYYITKNAQWDQFATYAELSAATTFYSWGVARIPTRNDYTIVLADEDYDNATTRYIYNSWWEYQYTINETAMSQAQLDALNSWITSGKVSTYDGYATTISGKQDALSLAASPTSWHIVTWWANNKTFADGWAIPTVPTNVSDFTNDAGYITSSSLPWKASSSTLWTVKLGSDTVQSISAEAVSWTANRTYAIQTNASDQLVVNVPWTDSVTSVNGSTWAVSVSEFNPWGTATTGYVVKKTADGYEWAAESWAVTSVNGQTWAVTVLELPSWWTEWQILMIVSWTPTWVTPVNQWFVMQASGSPTAIKYIWAWTEAQYSSATKNANTHYDTY